MVQLRLWGSERAWPLAASREWHIGSAPECSLQIVDDNQYVSRRHALLRREPDAATRAAADGWMLRDAGSKNGIRQDGALRLAFALSPGVEVGIGGVRLVAESARSIALRAYLQRLLGWTPEAGDRVDDALRCLRLHAVRCEPLVLGGDGDLSATARELHRRIADPDAKFRVCGPGRDALDAAQAVAGDGAGTLCVWAQRLPKNFARLSERIREPGAGIRLMICAHGLHLLDAVAGHPIVVPPISSRPDGDLDRIITESALDAIAQLGAPPDSFTSADHDWVRRSVRPTHAEIDRAALRRIAMRISDGVITRAAIRLGISHVALSRWLARRRTMAR